MDYIYIYYILYLVLLEKKSYIILYNNDIFKITEYFTLWYQYLNLGAKSNKNISFPIAANLVYDYLICSWEPF